MNILVIAIPFVFKPVDYYNLPMGLLYLASSLEKLGHHVTILNLNEVSDGNYERIIKYNVVDKDVVMLGGLSIHYNTIQFIIGLIKKYTNASIIVGGGLVSSQSELISQLVKADCFVSGECEGIIEEALRMDKKIYYGDTVPISILDTTFPAYHLLNMELYLGLQRPSDNQYRSIVNKPREAAIIASRGCPYNCTFCFHPTGPKYRNRSIDSIFSEIDLLVDRYNINILSIYDELFSINKTKLHDFIERIKRYKLKWSCQLRADSVEEDDLQEMKESGCYIISLGIESGSDTALRSYKKKITTKQIEETLRATKKVGIAVQGNILIGAEADTYDTVQESLAWWDRHKEYKFSIVNVIPYPGTEMYRNAFAAGKLDSIKFLEQGCPAINCSQLSDEEAKTTNEQAVKMYHAVHNAKMSNVDMNLAVEKFDSYGRYNISFDLTCPHCGKVDRRENFALNGILNGIFFCRSCFMRFHISEQIN